MEFAIPILAEMKEQNVISPEEYTFWKNYENRTFYIDYEIDEDYRLIELSKIIIQINLEEKDIPKDQLKPIYIWIHTYGGDIDQSLSFCDLLHSSRVPIITVAMGVAMSAGSLIFLAGHRRYAFAHTQVLIHSGSAGFSGTASEMEEFQKNYKKTLSQMKEYILQYSNIDEKTFNKNKNKDWYLTSEELVQYKIVDKLIESFDDIL